MSSSDIFIGETIGTAVLILLGGGVCAAVTLKRSKAQNAGCSPSPSGGVSPC